MTDEFVCWLGNLPKAELHLHLEGAIPLPTLWALIQKYGGDGSVAREEDLRARLTYRDFPHFIETWIWKNSFLRTYEDFQLIAEAVAEDLARQNIRYAEIFYSPSRFADRGLTPQGLTEAIRAGLDDVRGTEVHLIPDLVRDHGPARAAETLSQIADVIDYGIVGIGMGGSEHMHPPKPFAPIYARARDLGLRTSVHAGEAAGADSVREALDALAVDRIGHGTRAEEDPAVLDLLAEHQVTIEMCPLSNLATGVVSDLSAHPVRRYWDLGLQVTINTDDPGMFHNSLVEEFTMLSTKFGFTPDEIRQLTLNALDAAWRPASERDKLRRAFESDPVWRRTPPSG